MKNQHLLQEIKVYQPLQKSFLDYLAAGKFILKIKGDNYREANQQMQKTLDEIEEKSKKYNCEFEVKEK